MNDDASITMLLNRGLSRDEEKRLGALDREISTALESAGITARCGWLARDENHVHVLEIVVLTENDTAFFRMPATELPGISDETLLERLNDALG